MDHAAQMLSQHAGAVRAEVWDGDRLVFTLPRPQAGDPGEGRMSAG
ncbi:hypothetical protein [Phenylobacterium sp.]|nr:hypothetical protein [Phenylobacterium sp.]